jgi:hypothetical protein
MRGQYRWMTTSEARIVAAREAEQIYQPKLF